MTRAMCAATALLCAIAVMTGAANAKPRHQKQPRIANTGLVHCVSDGTYRQTCGQPDKRIHGNARVSTAYMAGSLVDRARHYLGTNPTGKRSLWCGRFMALIAPAAAAKVKNPDMARDWASLHRVPPQVGAIAVMSRGKRGGHVGVVTGFDANGNPIVVSGNHNNTVGEGVYPRSRVIAYVGAS